MLYENKKTFKIRDMMKTIKITLKSLLLLLNVGIFCNNNAMRRGRADDSLNKAPVKRAKRSDELTSQLYGTVGIGDTMDIEPALPASTSSNSSSSNTIRLELLDGCVDFPKDLCVLSTTMQNMLDDFPESNEPLPLPNITTDVWKLLKPSVKTLHNLSLNRCTIDAISNQLDFYNLNNLVKIFFAANYLDIKTKKPSEQDEIELMDLSAQAIVRKLLKPENLALFYHREITTQTIKNPDEVTTQILRFDENGLSSIAPHLSKYLAQRVIKANPNPMLTILHSPIATCAQKSYRYTKDYLDFNFLRAAANELIALSDGGIVGKIDLTTGDSTQILSDKDYRLTEIRNPESYEEAYPQNPTFYINDQKTRMLIKTIDIFGNRYEPKLVDLEHCEEILLRASKINCYGFDPTGYKIAITTTQDRTAQILSANTGKIIQTLPVDNAYAKFMEFSPRGNRIVTTHSDGKTRIWDTETGQCVNIIALENQTIKTKFMEFSPRGNRFATKHSDGKARIWDTETGQCVNIIALENQTIKTAGFSPSGRALLIYSRNTNREKTRDLVYSKRGYNFLSLWDVETGKLKTSLEVNSSEIPFEYLDKFEFNTAEDKILLLVSKSSDRYLKNTLYIWNVQTDNCLHKLQIDDHIRKFTFNKPGNKILTQTGFRITQLWTEDGEEILSIPRSIIALFSNTGDKLITLDSDKILKLWDLETGLWMKITTFPCWDCSEIEIILYPSDDKIIVCSGTCNIKIINLKQALAGFNYFKRNITLNQALLLACLNHSVKQGRPLTCTPDSHLNAIFHSINNDEIKQRILFINRQVRNQQIQHAIRK